MGSPEVLRLVFGLVAAELEGEVSPSKDAFEALAAWLLDRQGVALERRPWKTYRALAESVREGTSDVAWLPPVVYAWLAEGVAAVGTIARGGATSYAAALVTREGSDLRSLNELRGARAGWVDPWSAAGYVLPRIELARAGIDPGATFSSETFYGTHREVLLALQRGDCDVAGTYARTVAAGGEAKDTEGAWSEIEDLRVHVLATFGSIPGDVVAVRRNLPPAAYERILAALRGASRDEAGRAHLRAVFGGDELREGAEPGHEELRLAYERATANGLFD